jgi:hypothetical protein
LLVKSKIFTLQIISNYRMSQYCLNEFDWSSTVFRSSRKRKMNIICTRTSVLARTTTTHSLVLLLKSVNYVVSSKHEYGRFSFFDHVHDHDATGDGGQRDKVCWMFDDRRVWHTVFIVHDHSLFERLKPP